MVRHAHVCRFEVFAADTDRPIARWHSDQPVAERALDRHGVDRFVKRVEQGYRAASPDLRSLGADLFQWIDGPSERWLARSREGQRPILLHIDCDERLRSLPWELLFDETFLAVDPINPVMPVRLASSRIDEASPPANRPLRIAFMASSPTNVQPELAFESEEATILAASPRLVDVVVEESGSLAGLGGVFEHFGNDHFDVLHLSGHATIDPHGPRLLMEDDLGKRVDVSADELTETVEHRWPPLTFLSACHTAGATTGGEAASMSESLVAAGASAVVGWGLPVGDYSATKLASALYGALASGSSLEWAVTRARRELYTERSPYWHLLRLYTDSTPLAAYVTPPNAKDRIQLRTRPVSELFLDANGHVRVAGADGFVGRRRLLQRTLHALRSPDAADDAHVIVLHGMGGLGKSTVAARVVERLRPTHRHAAWFGKLDATEFRLGDPASQLGLDRTRTREINELLSSSDLAFADQIRLILDGPLSSIPVVFVFDDFENGNLDADGAGGHICTPAARELLESLARAIQQTSSPSRVLVTSRFEFPLAGVRSCFESLDPLAGVALDKKLSLTRNLGPASQLPAEVRSRAIVAAAGVPRLIERVDELITDSATDHEALVENISSSAVAYREELLLATLLAHQEPATRDLLCRAAVYEVPVPAPAIEAIVDRGEFAQSLQRAVAVGLLDRGISPINNEPRYLVSELVRPLLNDVAEQLSTAEAQAVIRGAAKALYGLWVVGE